VIHSHIDWLALPLLVSHDHARTAGPSWTARCHPRVP
jgi:hypothetical protein